MSPVAPSRPAVPLSELHGSPGYDLKVRTIHPDAARFAQVFAPDWRPAGKLGGVDLYAEVSGSPSALSIAAIQGMAGPVSIQGDATVDLEKERPVIDARFQTGEIVLHQFLQASSRAMMVPSLIQPALAAEGRCGRTPPSGWTGCAASMGVWH